MDIDSDGTDERDLIYHRKDSGIEGDEPDVFFKDPDKIALEIGPLNAPGIAERTYMKAGYQEALKEHKMKVFYKGQPLADTEVAVLTQGCWEKREKTDSSGIVLITPVENEEKGRKTDNETVQNNNILVYISFCLCLSGAGSRTQENGCYSNADRDSN